MSAPGQHLPPTPGAGSDPETIPAAAAADRAGSPIAVHVTGPGGGRRHLARPGQLLSFGRGAEVSIAVDDGRVSRSHAAVHLGAPATLTDLGSANGTFLGGQRLRAGEARQLGMYEPFMIGDSSVVLQPSGLASPAAGRLLTVSDLGARPHPPAGQALALVKVRATRATELAWIAAIMNELLRSPQDWLLRLEGGEMVAVVAVASAAEVLRVERAALDRLASWSVAATIDSVFVPAAAVAGAFDGGLELLHGGGVVNLADRGAVILHAPAMRALHRTLVRVASAPVSVLVLGETGVGKDVVASMLHELSPRAGKPLVRLNCASLPEPLLESELFGYERGAFTGAAAAKPGLLEVADGGTVFLDEIGDMAATLQPKLLRAIESAEIVRLGGVRARRIDVRFVAATNLDLADEVAAGRFRRDLYHRLNTVTVNVPPLRERREEIEPLARHFLARACARFGVPSCALAPAAVAALEAQAWPGNVRELRNVVERAALLAGAAVLEPHHLGLTAADGAVDDGAADDGGGTADTARAAAELEPPPLDAEPATERARIEEALRRCAGNQSRAAKLLGMSRRTLIRRIAGLGLPRPHR